MIDEDYLTYMYKLLEKIRDGILDDSSPTRAAYYLGILMNDIATTINNAEDEDNEH